MTLVLELPPELEQKLTKEAHEEGVTTADYALRILDQGMALVGRNRIPQSADGSNRADRLNAIADDVFDRRRSAYQKLAEGSA